MNESWRIGYAAISVRSMKIGCFHSSSFYVFSFPLHHPTSLIFGIWIIIISFDSILWFIPVWSTWHFLKMIFSFMNLNKSRETWNHHSKKWNPVHSSDDCDVTQTLNEVENSIIRIRRNESGYSSPHPFSDTKRTIHWMFQIICAIALKKARIFPEHRHWKIV